MGKYLYRRALTGLLMLLLGWTARAEYVGEICYDDQLGLFYEITSVSPRQVAFIHPPDMASFQHYSGVVAIPDTFWYSPTKPFLVTSLKDSAFFNCSTVTKVELPASLRTIGWDVFSGMTMLDTIRCHGEIPPTMQLDLTGNSSSMGRLDQGGNLTRWRNHVVLRVPCSGINNYTSATGWSMASNNMGESMYMVYYDTICQGDDYVDRIYPFYYLRPTTDIYVMHNIAGGGDASACTFDAELHLTVNPTYHPVYSYYFCDAGCLSYHDHGFSINCWTGGNHTFYQNLLTTSGCDSIIRLDFRQMVSQSTFHDSVCAGSAYNRTFNGTLTFTLLSFETAVGDTDIVMTKYFSPSSDASTSYQAGCQQTVTAYIHVNPITNDTLVVETCEGYPYTWSRTDYVDRQPVPHVDTYDSTVFVSDTLYTRAGCTAYKTLDLTVHPTSDTVLHDTICAEECLPFGYYYVNTPGIHTALMQNVHFCDSLATMHLTVRRAYSDYGHIHTRDLIYQADFDNPEDRYQWQYDNHNNGWRMRDGALRVSASANTNSYNVSTASDSYALLAYPTGTYDSIEVRFPYVAGGQAYADYLRVTVNNTQSAALFNASREYVATYANTRPNSMDTLRLYWHDNGDGRGSSPAVYIDSLEVYGISHARENLGSVVLSEDICQGGTFSVGSQQYTATGTYESYFGTQGYNCDSIVVLRLTVHEPTEATIDTAFCDGGSIRFGDSTFSATTYFTDHLLDRWQCDSTMHLDLTVWESPTTVLNVTHLGDDPYLFLGEALYSSGSYTYHLPTTHGCDSTIILNLVIHPNAYTTIEAEICDGETYAQNGFHETATGTYVDSLHTIYGADSVVTLHLVVHPVFDDTIHAVICDRQTFTFGGETYTQTGVYTDLWQSIHGCDSISTLDLTVNPITDTVVYDTVRGDGGYAWYGQTLYQSGVYTSALPNQYQCDSITLLHLQIYNTAAGHIYAEICDDQYFDSADFHTNQPGTHTIPGLFTVVGHADSTSYLHLVVHPTYNDTITASICDRESYSFGGRVYTETGVYTDHLTSVHGCDSVSTLSLWVRPVFDSVIYDTVRGDDGYVWYGQTLYMTGDYRDTLPNQYQCDSITLLHLQIYNTAAGHIYAEICDDQYFDSADFHTNQPGTHTIPGLFTVVGHADSTSYLHLVVHPTYNDTILDTICDRQTYTFGGNPYTTAGVYTDSLVSVHGCDSISTLNLWVKTVHDFVVYDTVRGDEGYDWYGHHYDSTGVYLDTMPNQYQCDSITLLHLQIYNTAAGHIYAEICDDQYFDSADFHTNQPGTHTIPGLFTVVGHADSTSYLHLVVHPTYNDTIPDTICDRQTYTFGGNPYTTAGVYTDSLVSVHGCDSISTLNLWVKTVHDFVVYDTVRGDDGYDWYGHHYDSTGVYLDTMPNHYQCDSITLLHLQIYNTAAGHIYAEICDNQYFDSADFHTNQPGTHTIPGLFTVVGHADSTSYLHLVVHPTFNDTIPDTICDRQTYTFGGNPYTTAGVYTDHLFTVHSCDSLSTLNLWVKTVHDFVVYDTVRGDEGYDWYGHHYDSTGVYLDTMPNQYQCDSITLLHLQIYNTAAGHIYAEICDDQYFDSADFRTNVPGVHRIDSLFTVVGHADSTSYLHLVVHPTFNDTILDTICDRQTYTFGGNPYTTAGVYTDHLFTVHSCDSLSTLNLWVKTVHDYVVYDTVRDDNGYDWYGHHLDSTGVYTDTLLNQYQCDSITELHLKVYNTARTDLYDTICHTQVYNGYGFSGLTAAGIYEQHQLTFGGADSVIWMHLWVNPVYDDTLVHHICDRTTYTGFGNHMLSQTGFTTDSLTTWRQCDSVVTLHLIVDPVYEVPVYDTLRGDEPYNFLGTWVDTTGLYTDTLPTIRDCDSIIHLHLQVYKNAYTHLYDTICDRDTYEGYGFSGLTTMGDYVDSLLTYGLSDSVVTMHLWVNPVYEVDEYDTICSNRFIVHHGDTLSQAGVYIDTLRTIHNCDSIVTFYLHVKPAYFDTTRAEICDNESYRFHFQEHLTDPGNYHYFMTARNGCDSVETLMLTVHPTYNDTIYDSILPTENYTFGTHTLYDPGFYTDSLTSQYGCDSTVHLVLTHWYLHTARLHDTICDGDGVWFNDFWCTRDSVYTDTLLAASDGMDSLVVLFLKVNPVYNDTLYDSIFCTQWYIFGEDSLNVDTTVTHYLQSIHGCDSIVTLHLHIHTVRDLDTVICMDQMPAIWHGVVFFDTLITEPTLLLDTAIVWNDTAQRDIMLALHLTVLPNPIQTIADTIVENQLPFNFRGYTYTGNVAADTLLLPATEGCDTTTYYSLYYHPNVSAETDSTVCWGQLPLVWNGVTFNAPEGVPLITRTTTILAHTGADSVLTMHLHVLQNTYTTRHDTIVENQLPYQVHGHIYFTACPLDTLTLVNTVGCDSVIYFRLMVNGNDVTMLDTSLCDYLLPLNWNDRIFNDPGTTDLLADTTIYHNLQGADSMVIMRVHILRCSSTVFDTTLCSASLPARWRGVNFQVPQDMPCTLVDTVRLLTPTGADSLIILRMRVNETFNQTFFDTTCSNHPYIFLGQSYATSATLNAELQTRAGCDSNVVVHLKVWSKEESLFEDIICPGTSYYWIDGHTYTSPISGPFTTLRTIHGCDSVVTLQLRIGEEAHASIGTNKQWVEADDHMVRLVDDTPHGLSRVWCFPDSTSTLMLVHYAYPIDYDSVRIYLTATNHDGCTDTTSILLRLDRDFVWAPNAFTPALSENSHFRIFGDGLLNVKVYVYNRAGLLVASWEGLEGSWDGKHNGIPCPQAAYTYKVTYTTLRHPRDPQQKVGSVLLLR